MPYDVEMPIEERKYEDTLGNKFRMYSNGFGRVSYPEEHVSRWEEVDPDGFVGAMADKLRPDLKKYFFSDSPYLTFATMKLDDTTVPMELDGLATATNVADEHDTVKIKDLELTVETVRPKPKGTLLTGLCIYDREDIEEKIGRKVKDLVLTGAAYNKKTIHEPWKYKDNIDLTYVEYKTKFMISDWGQYKDDMSYQARVQTRAERCGYSKLSEITRLAGPRHRCLAVADGPEERARALLFRMIGPQAFRRYLKRGFFSYKAVSGDVYQIGPGHTTVKVWRNGEPVEQLCAVFQDRDLPPTDSAIMRLLMLENDEAGFRAVAISSRFTPPQQRPMAVVPMGRVLTAQQNLRRGA